MMNVKDMFFRKGKIFVAAMLSLLAIVQAVANRESDSLITQELFKVSASPFFVSILFLMAIFVVGTMIYDLRREGKRHKFKIGSQKFYDFFSKWYKKPGKLTLFCDDLNWVATNGNSSILNELKNKSQQDGLILFLGEKSATRKEILSELEKAEIYQAPSTIISQYSFSCLSAMGNNSSVIVRNKQSDSGHVVKFEELSNNYATGLLNALIQQENLRHIDDQEETAKGCSQ